MGIQGDFTSTVSKDLAGKNYHQQLANELAKFLDTVIDQAGGVIGLVDLYCMYNRARGTDMISPEDLHIAAVKLNLSGGKFMLKQYASGLKTI